MAVSTQKSISHRGLFTHIHQSRYSPPHINSITIVYITRTLCVELGREVDNFDSSNGRAPRDKEARSCRAHGVHG